MAKQFNRTSDEIVEVLKEDGFLYARKGISAKYSKLELIRHFIRGYFDGDGCISYANKEHTVINIQLLGTKEFLLQMLQYLPEEFHNLTPKHNHNNPEEITHFINTSNHKAEHFCSYLYDNSTISLDRKYLRWARHKSDFMNERDKIGEL